MKVYFLSTYSFSWHVEILELNISEKKTQLSMKFSNHQTKNECHIEFYDFVEETGKKSRAKDQIKFNLLDVIKLYLLLLYILLLRIPKK